MSNLIELLKKLVNESLPEPDNGMTLRSRLSRQESDVIADALIATASNRLTPEREREIREWLPVARRSAMGRVYERETIECAEELLAELDAVRAILEPSAMQEFYRTHAINVAEISFLQRVRSLQQKAQQELYAFAASLR